uniref:NADH-ubiquinone oxidoreductase chain 5 n=1 Tax=Trimma grammistes TaxID=1231923 RepID=A0A455TQR9_9GOBI|nr:NADH dehydrogenase subunit 5 [Trimma grammistes]
MTFSSWVLTTTTLLHIAFVLVFSIEFFGKCIFKHTLLSMTKTTVKLAFLVSLIALFTFLDSPTEIVYTLGDWVSPTGLKVNFSLYFDGYTMVFIPVALYVSWAILEFSLWYMESDPTVNYFLLFLILFLMTMLILLSASNLFMLFVGWEGVGIMSFLLIGWWWAREEANTAAVQAVLYNRIGDVGFIFAMGWLAGSLNSLEFQQMFSHPHPENLPPAVLGLVLAAMSKSAQFGLHPWLPAAMEGPTPVSALLHSSTMVVAGIFLLVRTAPLFNLTPAAQTICLCLGALTSFFSATCALTQNDLKKIIAFSTASQLGLMMVAIGLHRPELAFLHMCTHAFFKAMLFLCSGVIIHALDGEQDIRKMGGIHKLMPMTSSCLTIGSLALTGTPYLAGFCSKDQIIEALNTSNLNTAALILTLIATSFTAVYSLRIVYYVLMGTPRFGPLVLTGEHSPLATNPLKRLAYATMVMWILAITPSLLPTPASLAIPPMPLYLKMAALSVALLGLILALELTKLTNSRAFYTPKLPPYKFSALVTFFPNVIHRLPPRKALTKARRVSAQKVDQTLLPHLGPKAVAKINIPAAVAVSNSQNGNPKTQLLMLLWLLVTAIAYILW